MLEQYYIKRVDINKIEKDVYIKLWNYTQIDYHNVKELATVFEGDNTYSVIVNFLKAFAENKNNYAYVKTPVKDCRYLITRSDDDLITFFMKDEFNCCFVRKNENATIYDNRVIANTDLANLKELFPNGDFALCEVDDDGGIAEIW